MDIENCLDHSSLQKRIRPLTSFHPMAASDLPTIKIKHKMTGKDLFAICTLLKILVLRIKGSELQLPG